MKKSNYIDIVTNLIERPSLTPRDEGCQEYIYECLKSSGYSCINLNCGVVTNSLIHSGSSSPSLLFVGHTDVVPAGPLESWDSPPFTATIKDKHIYGRGAADMKGSVAVITTLLQHYSVDRGSIGLLLTSDEEGTAIDGVKHAIKKLYEQGMKFDLAIVGEPTSHKEAGDTIKIGRRGSLSGQVTIQGKQGHVAYPQLADNPIHHACINLSKLTNYKFNDGDTVFDDTSLQLVNIHSGQSGIYNVIPDTCRVDFNIRFTPKHSSASLKKLIEGLLANDDNNYSFEYQSASEPFLNSDTALIAMVKKAVAKTTCKNVMTSTSGGTSDGRYLAPYGIPVVELGPVNATIHTINEQVAISDLDMLYKCYGQIIQDFFA